VTGRLAERVVIVTGASRGLGAAIAQRSAAEGACVVVAARTRVAGDALPGTIDDVAASIAAVGGSALAVACDVTVDDDLVALVETTLGRFGTVDILVNNAAATVPGRPGKRPRSLARSATADGSSGPSLPSLEQIPLKAVRTQFDVNLFAPWRLTQLVAPVMRRSRRGAIVNISSEAARMPGSVPAYGASKLALEHLTASAARELGPHGIAVAALAPSYPIATPGLAWVGSDLAAAASADDFAEAVVRLALGDPSVVGGRVHHHADLLHPGEPDRGWIGATQ
jgi:NAD(P)-dependent dehydrogenase (short-subunit alcohol dehydrogenase family)